MDKPLTTFEGRKHVSQSFTDYMLQRMLHTVTTVIWTLLAVLLLPSTPLTAQGIPEAMLTARTATVYADEDVPTKTVEAITANLKKWNRYQLLEDGGELTIHIAKDALRTDHVTDFVFGTPGLVMQSQSYRLSFKKGATLLYTDTLHGKNIVNDLDKRMKKQEMGR